MKKIIFVSIMAFCFLFVQKVSFAQNLGDYSPQMLQMRVKQVDEFMARFNYELSPEGQPQKYTKKDVLKRKSQLLSLFDSTYVNVLVADSSKRAALNNFIDSVTNPAKPVFLGFTQKQWFAEVVCVAKFAGKEYPLTLLLETESDKLNNLKWVITGAYASFMNLSAKDSSYRSISPVDHELGFNKLEDITKTDRQNIFTYTQAGYVPESLPVFLFLVKNNLLSVEYVKQIKFHFLKVPGYTFVIENINRKSTNAGWLITNIEKNTDTNKKYYFKKFKVIF